MITYRQFRCLVDAEVSRVSGLGLSCLADCDISDYWDSELTDDDARALAIECAQRHCPRASQPVAPAPAPASQ